MRKPLKTIRRLLGRAFEYALVCVLIAELSIAALPVMAGGIAVDQSASGNKPTVDTAPNGVPLVNLAKTDGRGVSHNKFTDYNVGPGGVILNNSTADGVSVLGGAIYGNPNFRGGCAASLVINEVTGNKASNLRGYTEMFGRRADFILANPNGIVLNGAGFINIPRVTLSTGVPVFDAGVFRGLDIAGGNVSIEGSGVDATQADYFTIVTRMASLSAPVWGRDVSIITGTGFYNHDDRVFTLRDTPEGKPEFAIDASALGSIYAGRISLVCNEQGVGVRSKADMLADAADIRIRADGNIELKNAQAATDVRVWSGSGEIIQTGTALALGDLEYGAARVANRGSLLAVNDLAVTGLLDNEGGEIAAGGNIMIAANDALNNRGGSIRLGGTDTGSVHITGLAALDGEGGAITSSGALVLDMTGDITLSGATGLLYAGRAFTLNAANVVNDTTLEMDGSVTINAGGDLTNHGRISSASGISINAAHVENSDALADSGIFPEISSGDRLAITAEGITNSGGLLFAVNGITLESASLSNVSTNIDDDNLLGNAYIYSMGGMAIRGKAASGNTLYNHSAYIGADGDMAIELGSDGTLVNTGADLGTYTKEWVSTGAGFGKSWAVLARDVITNGDMRTASSYLVSGGNLSINAGDVLNHGSEISAAGNLTIDADTLTNETHTVDVSQKILEGKRTRHTKKIDLGFGKIKYETYYTNDTRYRYETVTLGSNTTALIQGKTVTIRANKLGNGIERSTPGSAAGGRVGTVTNNAALNELVNTGAIDVSRYVSVDGNALFAINTAPGTTYLIETRNRFIDLNGLYGSQYFFDRIGYSPGDVKILGDAYYEEQLIMRAIYQATAEKYLGEDIASNQEEMKYLLDNAATAYKDLSLAVGVALTKEQINLLQEPIVWYVEETVKGITVLAPKIYIPEHIVAGFTNGGTAKIAAGTVNMDITEGLTNSGLIAGKSSLVVNAGKITNTASGIEGMTAEIRGGEVDLVSAGDIINRGAVIKAGKTLNVTAAGDIVNETSNATGSMIAEIKGGDVNVVSGSDVVNRSAVINADRTVSITAAGNIVNETTVKTTRLTRGEIRSTLGTTASIESGDRLSINAGGDFTNRGAEVKSGSDAVIEAGGNIDFETVKLRAVKNERRHGVKGVSDGTTSIGSELDVNGNLSMSAGRDVNFVGSAADIEGKADVKTAGNFNLLNDYDTDSFKGKKRSGNAYKSKTTKVQSYDKTVVGSSFTTGDDLNVESGNDINIIGSTVSSGKDMKLSAAGTENIVAVNDEHYFKKETKKSGFAQGGSIYGKEARQDMTYDSKVKGSTVDVRGTYASHSGKDTNIIGSTLTAGDLADISADGSVNIVAAYDRHDESHTTVKTGIGGAKDIYSQELDLEESGYTKAVGSVITAKELTVRSGADVYVEGSTLNAENATIDAAGNFTETSAKNTSYHREVHEKTGVSVMEAAKYAGLMTLTGGMASPLNAYLTTLVTGHATNNMAKEENGRVSVEMGRVEYERSEKTVETITQASSILNITNDLAVSAGKDLTIAGSEVNAGWDVTLTAGGNVNILSTEESSKTTSETIKGSGVVTVGAKHAATDVYYAGKALAEAVKALETAKKDYDDYKENIRKAREDKGKGLIDEDDYEALESMEKYYLANIALLTENVVAKTANLVKATAGLGSSGETLGFSGDIQLDIDASITKNKEESTTRKGSTLFAGGNLAIQSGKTAKIEGSDLGAEGELSIDAEDVEITAARNTNKSSSSTRQAHINGSYSTNGSWGVNADASYSEMDSESTTWANSRLNATNISITSKNDTTVRGAVVSANEQLDLNVGGNLIVESLQDKSSSGSHSLGLSAGYSESKSGSGLNAGGNFSVSSSTRKWVSEQTSLTGNSVNIYVENKTTLKGAVIASTSNDLTLDTGSFEYIHIKDKDISYNAGAGVNLGSNSTGKPEEKNNTWSVNASYGFSQKRQTNFATIGEGTIIVRDGETDLSGLNRDVTKAQYGTVDIGLKGGFTVDSSTVAFVTDPEGEIKNAIDSLKKGYGDAAKTTEEIYEKSVVMYERTTNFINDKGFYTNKEIRINECIQVWNDDSKYGIGAQLYEKYKEVILGSNFYKDTRTSTDLKLAYIELLGIDPTGTILDEVQQRRHIIREHELDEIARQKIERAYANEAITPMLIGPIDDLFPGFSDLKDLKAAITGYDEFNDKLSGIDRAASIAGAALPIVSGKMVKAGIDVVSEGAEQIAKHGDAVSKITKETKIIENKIKGDAFRDEISYLMNKEGFNVQTEVAKNTPFGKRVIDIEVSKDGRVLGGIETKAGKSPYTPSQRAKDNWLKQQGYQVDVVRDK
ncbi:MAG TPA: hemagglutinin repeat-containing protein [Spirochaetota bacterium]|nr:hemagglutinin repeat-containing protein [Spirochaetota bacterium]